MGKNSIIWLLLLSFFAFWAAGREALEAVAYAGLVIILIVKAIIYDAKVFIAKLVVNTKNEIDEAHLGSKRGNDNERD